MNAQHTPGPWMIGPAVDSRKVFQGDTVIAEAWPITINMAEAHANARLIAAAPELLAACEMALADESTANTVAIVLRATILKAQSGEEP